MTYIFLMAIVLCAIPFVAAKVTSAAGPSSTVAAPLPSMGAASTPDVGLAPRSVVSFIGRLAPFAELASASHDWTLNRLQRHINLACQPVELCAELEIRQAGGITLRQPAIYSVDYDLAWAGGRWLACDPGVMVVEMTGQVADAESLNVAAEDLLAADTDRQLRGLWVQVASGLQSSALVRCAVETGVLVTPTVMPGPQPRLQLRFEGRIGPFLKALTADSYADKT